VRSSEVVVKRPRIDVDWRLLVGRLSRRHGCWAFALYLALGLLLEHRAVAHLNSVCACTPGADPTEYMWGMVWFPYAIMHGLNPLVTHELWAGSGGFDLAVATFTPAEALIAWPITAIAGPFVAFNVLSIVAPAVGAWFAYRLCFYVTKKPAASIVGGYLFGFSSYELGQLLGHLQLSVTWAIPAAVLLTLKRIDGTIGARRYVLLIAAALAFQLLTSTEVLLTLTCLGAVVLACAWLVSAPAGRRRIAKTLPELLAAYGLMILVCSPYLYYAFSHSGITNGPIGADALSLFIPTWLTTLGASRFFSVSSTFPGNLVEQGTYLGLPLIAIVAAYAIQNWRARTTKILIAALTVAVVWALGDHLYVDGHPTIGLPWLVFWHLPLLKLVITIRLGLYISLACAVIAALWLAAPSTHHWRRWLLAALAVAFLIPNINARLPGSPLRMFNARLPTPTFFATGLYRRYLRRDEIVLPLPYGSYGYSLLWQARTDMYFRLASGRFRYPPASYPQQIANELMGRAAMTPNASSLLRSFVISEQISDVVADPAGSGPWLGVLTKLGLRPVSVGGVLLYRVPSAWSGARSAV
jgi:hypothetical protein